MALAWGAGVPGLLGPRLPSPRRRACPSAPTCSAAAPPAPISASHLSLWWPDGRPALRDVSLFVAPGQLTMVAGANGCGKSTLLAALHGLRLPDLGRARAARPCGFLVQDAADSLPLPTVAVNVAISVPATRPDHPDHWRTDERVVRGVVRAVLAEVGFDDPDVWMPRLARDLSGGEKQRVAFAAALAMQPRTLLFDEISASMDAANKALVLDLVPRIVRDRNIAALWVTHTREELQAADAIILLDKGAVVDTGPPSKILPLIDSQFDQNRFFSDVEDFES